MRTRLSQTTSKAANAVLGNAELVSRILGHIPQKNAFRDASLQLALTCKAFSSAALDCLWKNMDNLIPLFDLLPGLEPRYEREVALVVRDVSKLHLTTRFKGYARRIRNVVVKTVWTGSIPSAIYAIILRRLATSANTLLPNARSIYVKSVDAASFHPCLITLLINSSIRKLDMAKGSSFSLTPSHNAAVFSTQIAEDLADTLEDLTVSNMVFTDEDDTAWLSLCRLRSLRSLTLLRGSRPVPSITQILPLFMRLQELKIEGNDIPKSLVPFIPVASNLSTLTVECQASAIPLFLARHSFPCLTKLSLTVKERDDDELALDLPIHKWIDEVCDALTDTAPMLNTIILSWLWPQVFAASLVPLVLLPSMEHLHFQSIAYRTKLLGYCRAEDNELSLGVLLGAIASSSLKTFVYPPTAGLVSMSVFEQIWRLSTSLETVHLCINSDWTSEELTSKLPSDISRESALRRIHLYDASTTVFDPKEHKFWAKTLNEWFPKLEAITFANDMSKKMQESWAFIEELRVDFRQGR